jgi:hypothetical protein
MRSLHPRAVLDRPAPAAAEVCSGGEFVSGGGGGDEGGAWNSVTLRGQYKSGNGTARHATRRGPMITRAGWDCTVLRILCGGVNIRIESKCGVGINGKTREAGENWPTATGVHA